MQKNLHSMLIPLPRTHHSHTHTQTHSHTDEAYEILQGMEANGPEPNIYTYNTVTRAFAQAGRLEVRSICYMPHTVLYILAVRVIEIHIDRLPDQERKS